MPAATLTLTGERTLPGIAHENYWFRRHEAAYRWLAPFTRGARLLEAGCGEGYGAALLTAWASTVVAVDVDHAAAAHAAATYADLPVAQADLQRLPVRDGALDVVTSLQVLEHLTDQVGFVAECARVLGPGGSLLLTTPNRLTFSPGAGPHDQPLNPFHTSELTAGELAELLAPCFRVTRMAGLRHGRRLRRGEARHGPLVPALVAHLDPATWPARLRRRVERVAAADFEVSEDDVDRALDLVVVAVRVTA